MPENKSFPRNFYFPHRLCSNFQAEIPQDFRFKPKTCFRLNKRSALSIIHLRILRILGNKLTSGLYIVTHKHTEYLIGSNGVFQVYSL